MRRGSRSARRLRADVARPRPGRAVGRSGGYFRQPFASAERELRAWFAEQAAARGLRLENDGSATGGLVGRRHAAGRAHRLAPRLGPRRRRVRRAARRGLRAGRGRPAAGARRRAGAAGRGGGLRRGGGLAVRAACLGSRLATGRRRWEQARELRDRDGVRARRRRSAGRDGSSAARRRVGDFVELHVEQGRDLVDRGAAVGVAQRDLAARALPVRLHRRGQPRRHDPDGGPARPDADLRDDRAGRQQAGPARRAARDLRPGRGRAQRHQRGAVAGDRLAGRAVRDRRRRWPTLVDAITRQATERAERRRHALDGDRGVGVAARSPSTRTSRRHRGRPRGRRLAVIPTAAGHDAGILSAAGIPTAMLFVRNPTGVSHSPAEHAEMRRLPGRRRRPGRHAARGWPGDRRTARARLARRRGRRRVLVEVDDGRFTRRRRPAGGHPARDRVARPDDPRPRQLPQPRLPPRAARAHPRERGTFWTWREQMYAVAERLDPDTYFALAAGDLPRDGRGRDHQRRRVPLPAPPARRHAVRRPQRDGPGADRGRARGRHPDHAARHLLPRSGFGAPAEGVQARFSDGNAERWAARVDGSRGDDDGDGSARPSTPSGRCRATQLPTVVDGRGGPAAARPPVRAGRRERRLPRGVRRDPDPAARRGRRCSARGPPPCTPPT